MILVLFDRVCGVESGGWGVLSIECKEVVDKQMKRNEPRKIETEDEFLGSK